MAKAMKVSFDEKKGDKLEQSRSSTENMLFQKDLPSWALTEEPSFHYKMLPN